MVVAVQRVFILSSAVPHMGDRVENHFLPKQRVEMYIYGRFWVQINVVFIIHHQPLLLQNLNLVSFQQSRRRFHASKSKIVAETAAWWPLSRHFPGSWQQLLRCAWLALQPLCGIHLKSPWRWGGRQGPVPGRLLPHPGLFSEPLWSGKWMYHYNSVFSPLGLRIKGLGKVWKSIF